MIHGKPLFHVLFLSNSIIPAISCFTAIFSFGDSMTDTGNEAILADTCWGARFPYGETYFGRPTGRNSDGRLVVDFIAEGLGLPLLPPYQSRLTGQQDFRRGVNFAVAGATALSRDFLIKEGIDIDWTDYPLGTQIRWFEELLPSLCSSKSDVKSVNPEPVRLPTEPSSVSEVMFFLANTRYPPRNCQKDCDDLLGNSLFLVGVFGGNEYGKSLFQHKTTVDLIQNYVPFVIKAISSAINVLIELGAKTLVVPGIVPIGCLPAILVGLPSNKTDYDPETGCLIWVNELVELHNGHLRQELEKLRKRHTETTIIYGDYYGSVMRMYRFPYKFGFNKEVLDACCGVRGPYNYNDSTVCGEKGFDYLCDDPSRYICWDGNHLTEAAYKITADGLMKGPYADPSLFSLCSDRTTPLLGQLVNPVEQY